MKRMSGVQVYLIALVLIGFTGALLLEPLLARAALLLFTAICGWGAFRLETSRLREQAAQELERYKRQQDAVLLQIVNRMRHDWMNDLQLLFGYIQLKKYDNLQPYMEKLKVTMQRESNLSKLGIASLISFIIAFRAQSKKLRFEVELDREFQLQQLPVPPEAVFRVVRTVVELFEERAGSDMEGVGVLSLELDAEEEALVLDFVYQGAYDRSGLEQACRDRLLSGVAGLSLEMNELQEEEAALTFRLPFRN